MLGAAGLVSSGGYQRIRESIGVAPRQLTFGDERRRLATRVAVALAPKSRPIGRVTREKLSHFLPRVLTVEMCAPTRKRRSVMFAQGAAGSGRRRAASAPQKRRRRC